MCISFLEELKSLSNMSKPSQPSPTQSRGGYAGNQTVSSWFNCIPLAPPSLPRQAVTQQRERPLLAPWAGNLPLGRGRRVKPVRVEPGGEGGGGGGPGPRPLASASAAAGGAAGGAATGGGWTAASPDPGPGASRSRRGGASWARLPAWAPGGGGKPGERRECRAVAALTQRAWPWRGEMRCPLVAKWTGAWEEEVWQLGPRARPPCLDPQ